MTCSKNLKSKINIIIENVLGSHKSALSWINSKCTETWHLNTQTRGGHIQKLIKGGVHAEHLPAMLRSMEDHGV